MLKDNLLNQFQNITWENFFFWHIYTGVNSNKHNVSFGIKNITNFVYCKLTVCKNSQGYLSKITPNSCKIIWTTTFNISKGYLSNSRQNQGTTNFNNSKVIYLKWHPSTVLNIKVHGTWPWNCLDMNDCKTGTPYLTTCLFNDW